MTHNCYPITVNFKCSIKKYIDSLHHWTVFAAFLESVLMKWEDSVNPSSAWVRLVTTKMLVIICKEAAGQRRTSQLTQW